MSVCAAGKNAANTARNAQRYSRQTVLPEIGDQGQDRLSKARILCVGAGGLGCPALQYLVAAGVGHIGIVDHDTVDISNLQRQILFTENDIGRPKAIAAKQRLQDMNSDIRIDAHVLALSHDNVGELFACYDVVIDACDNFSTKFLINDACVKFGKPWVYGSILGFQGQMAVFDGSDPDAPCYRCLFPHPPTQNVLNCADAGVIGAVAGVLGTLQALEAMKIVLDDPEKLPPIKSRLMQIDLITMQKSLTLLPKEPKCRTCSGAPQQRAQISLSQEDNAMSFLGTKTQAEEITIDDVRQCLNAGDNVKVIDVREIDEWEAGHIDGADHCPLSFLMEGMRPDDLEKEAEIILYCKAGVRSMQALQILKAQGYSNLKNMSGGYDAWLRS